MKKSIAMAWARALRSGEYQQGRGALIEGEKYCCLGVLCVLAEEAEVIQRCDTESDGRVQFPDNDDNRTGVLPTVVQAWAGMNDSTGTIADPNSAMGAYASLMGMNDNGSSFKEIANMIEKKWHLL